MRSARSRMRTGSPMSSMKISPPRGEDRGLEHELHGLGDAHEVAGHPGVGDGDRAAGRDLAGEGRDDAAPAAEHVAEAHRAPAGARRRRRTTTICSPSHFERAHARCAGRTALSVEMNTRWSTPARGGARRRCAVPSTLVRDRLDRVRLEQRHVLVGGGVEDDLGPRGVEHGLAGRRGRGCRRAQLAATSGPSRWRDVVQVGLVVVEQHQAGRVELGDLARRSRSRSSRRRR